LEFWNDGQVKIKKKPFLSNLPFLTSPIIWYSDQELPFRYSILGTRRTGRCGSCSLFIPGFRLSWADPEMIMEKKSGHSKSSSAGCPTT
jgi:hypothetical protein